MTTYHQPERGAVSLLTAIIISILLAIITVGLITLMVSELRQSGDSEQSVRAYYAAQSGVEDGVRKVIQALGGPRVDQLCGGAGSQNLNLDPAAAGQVGWTCQEIRYSGSPSGNLPVPDQAVQIDVGPVSGPAFQSMRLEWDLTPNPLGNTASFYNAPNGNFPVAGGWNYAAPVELAIVDYPAAPFSASAPGAISLRNLLAVPRVGAAASVSYAQLKTGLGVVGVNSRSAACTLGATAYHCHIDITNMPSSSGRGYTFRLRSRYKGTDYRLTFYTNVVASGNPIPVPDGTATIDITAKAGPVFRRVIYKVPYRAGAAAGLDYVIYSDGDICKNFGIINGNVNPAVIGCPY
jgi:hypothetical protein